MKEFDILNNANVRKELMDNNKSLAVVEEYKHIETIRDTIDYLTITQVAEYFNVEYDAIRKLISRHKEELIENGLLLLNGTETREFFVADNVSYKNIQGGFVVDDFKFANKLNYLVDKRCLLNIAMLLTESKVAKGIRSKLLDITMGVIDNKIVPTDNVSIELVDNFKTQIDFLMEQIKIKDKLIESLTNIIQVTNNTNTINNETNFITQDSIELEILNFENELMTIQDFSKYLNTKNVIVKKLGVQIVSQLLRDNNLLNSSNYPLHFEYFKILNQKLYLTKEGMITTYRLAKEQITINYKVRKGI